MRRTAPDVPVDHLTAVAHKTIIPGRLAVDEWLF
jgi:hypothetical protein